jgi:hypothetical protein
MGLDMHFNIEVERFATEPVHRYGPMKLRLDGCTMQYGFQYFRKFNALHGWMVVNVQHGEDDCDTYPIMRAHWEKLLQDCEAVLDDPNIAEDVFPTTEGFFFGSMDYGAYYFSGLEKTVELCKKALAILEDPEKELGDILSDHPGLAVARFRFTYHASW